MRLVLLPGMDGTGDMFEPFMAAMAAMGAMGAMGPDAPIDVVRYSGTHPQGYAELEPLVRAQLPATAPFVLLGESFSGPLAISIAAAPPPGLRGLILCCSFARSPSPGLALLRGGLLELSMKLLHLNAMRAPMRRMLLGRFADAHLAALLHGSLRKVSGAVMAHRLKEVQRVNVIDKLAQVRVPSMYLQALQDRIVAPQAARALQQALPGLRVVRLDGPHGLLQAAPVAAANVIQTFIETLIDRPCLAPGDPVPAMP